MIMRKVLHRLTIMLALVLTVPPLGLAKEYVTAELNLLCTLPEERCHGMKQEFEARYGIAVNYLRMSGGEALARIQAERRNPQFDIWWGGPIDSFIAAKRAGLLETYESPNFINLLDHNKYKDKDNQWAGIYVGTIGFATNKRWLATHPHLGTPRSWSDLLRPHFRGQIIVGHPATSATSYAVIASILQMKGAEAGWSYLKQFAGQVAQFTKSGAAPAKFVGQGEAAVAILFSHEIVYEIRDNNLPLLLTFPEEGTCYEIGGMGILKGAKHLDAAKTWFDWALTAEAQSLGPKYKAYQAPTVKGVRAPNPELLEVKLIEYNFEWAGENKRAIIDKFINEIASTRNLK